MIKRAPLQNTTAFEKLWAWFFAIAIAGLIVVTYSLAETNITFIIN